MLNYSFKCNDTAHSQCYYPLLWHRSLNAYDYSLTWHGATQVCYSRPDTFLSSRGQPSVACINPKASSSCRISGLPHRLRLPLPCAAGAIADAEGGGGARNCHSFPPVWWRRSSPSSEAASFCSAPAAGENSMAQHPQHLPKSQPGTSQPGTPAHHCEALGVFFLLIYWTDHTI